jgi:hypothetical protein
VARKDNRSYKLVNVKFNEEGAKDVKIYWKNIYPYDLVKFGKAPGIFLADNVKLLLEVFL